MRRLIRVIQLLLIATLVINVSAYAGYKDGLRAYMEKDYGSAVKQWSKEDSQNDARALFALGVMFMRGVGVEKEQLKGADYYLKSARLGFPSAQFNLGLAHYAGRGVVKNLKKSKEWWQKAADQGHPVAQYNLGAILWSGEGINKDQALAMNWFRMAKANGNRDASNFLLTLFAPVYKELKEYAVELAAKDRKRTIPFIDQVGVFKLGLQALEKRNYQQAYDYWQPLALDGHVDSQYQVGRLLEDGLGVSKDFNGALEWYQRAAQKGQGDAQFRLGLYHMNENPDKNEALGFYWIQSAADNHSAEAIQYISNNL